MPARSRAQKRERDGARHGSSTDHQVSSSVPGIDTCLDHDDQTSRADNVRDFGNLDLSSAIKCNFYLSNVQRAQLSNFSSLPHLSSTLWLEANQVPGPNIEWVNRTFCDMRLRGRWLVQQGLDAAAIMGDTCPTLSPLHCDLRRPVDTDFWTVSKWATRFVEGFSHLSHSDKLACWIVIFVTFHVRLLFDNNPGHIDLADDK